MKRKGDITLFIIIGLVLIILLSMFFFFRNKNKTQTIKENGVINSQITPLVSFIEQCLKTTSYDAIKSLGSQGRLYSNYYLKSQTDKIAYFYYKGDGFFPTKIGVVEEELSRYIKENIGECMDYSSFAYDIRDEKDKMKLTTSFNSDNMD